MSNARNSRARTGSSNQINAISRSDLSDTEIKVKNVANMRLDDVSYLIGMD